jgi:hypothetical protein
VIADAARAIEPILKQVVFAGPPVVDLLMNDPAIVRARLDFTADRTLQLFSTSMIDRLGLDLQKLGLTRVGRTDAGDRWQIGPDLAVDLVQVRTDDSDPNQVWFEYATLLTIPLTLDERVTARIAAGPAMLALECAAFAASHTSVLDSEEVERIVLLVGGRRELERECAGAPPELRAFVAAQLTRINKSDAVQVVIERIIPDSTLLPALTVRIKAKMSRIAALAP